MKKIFLLAALAVSTLGFGQSNDQGTIQANLMWGIAFGSATDKLDIAELEDSKYTIASGAYGLKVHYGLSEEMSIGAVFKTGAYVLVPQSLDVADDYVDLTSVNNVTMSLVNFGVEGRYYVANSDNFNFFVGPSIGFSTGSDKFAGIDVDMDGEKTKYSGLNFGLNTGINYYFGDVFGLTFQLAYERIALSSKMDVTTGIDITTGEETKEELKLKRGVGLVQPMLGISLKF